jgi:hypothetical protein
MGVVGLLSARMNLSCSFGGKFCLALEAAEFSLFFVRTSVFFRNFVVLIKLFKEYFYFFNRLYDITWFWVVYASGL